MRRLLHDDPRGRPHKPFAGTTTLHLDRAGFSHVLGPVVARSQERHHGLVDGRSRMALRSARDSASTEYGF
jgi:hypothetical protein